jgi:hypothetical protein
MIIKIEIDISDEIQLDFLGDVLKAAKARGFHAGGFDTLRKTAATLDSTPVRPPEGGENGD